MPCITFPNVPNNAPVISRYGDDDTFVELSYRRSGAVIELVTTKVQYNGYTGLYSRDEIGREVVAPEDAGSVACDLEWDAADALDGVANVYSDPCDFETAVIREMDADPQADREYMVRAIAHNAAMIAAE